MMLENRALGGEIIDKYDDGLATGKSGGDAGVGDGEAECSPESFEVRRGCRDVSLRSTTSRRWFTEALRGATEAPSADERAPARVERDRTRVGGDPRRVELHACGGDQGVSWTVDGGSARVDLDSAAGERGSARVDGDSATIERDSTRVERDGGTINGDGWARSRDSRTGSLAWPMNGESPTSVTPSNQKCPHIPAGCQPTDPGRGAEAWR